MLPGLPRVTISMSKNTGKNTNENDEASQTIIPVDGTTAVTLVPALADDAKPHSNVTVTNDGNKSLWVRFYPAAQDDILTGERIAPGESRVIIENSEVYRGEISAIFHSGGLNNVHVRRY